MNDTLVGIQIRISTLRCLELLKMKKKKTMQPKPMSIDAKY